MQTKGIETRILKQIFKSKRNEDGKWRSHFTVFLLYHSPYVVRVNGTEPECMKVGVLSKC